MLRNRDALVRSRPARLFLQLASSAILLIDLHLGAKPRGGYQCAARGDLERAQGATKVRRPAVCLAAGHFQGVDARLQVAIVPVDRSHVYPEKQAAAVGSPAEMLLQRLVVR